VRSLALLAAGDVLLAWLLSSVLSRRQALLAFVALVLPLVAAIVLFRRGRRRPLYGVVYVTLLAALAAALFEVALRARPQLLQGQLANVAYSGYHWLGGGIYDLDPHIGPVLRPGARRAMYWSGHRWRHEANAQGFRGPARDRADAVFLGDSMVYGHGLEEDDTLPAQFEKASGLATANLGQQGTGLVQDYLILRAKGAALRPRVVYLCVHFNDVEDALVYYEERELQRFVDAAPASADGLPLVRGEYRPRPPWDLAFLWSRYVALPTQAGGLASTVLRAALGRGSAPPPSVSRDPFVPTPEEEQAPVTGLSDTDDPARRLAWRAQRHAIARTKALCDTIGARLVVFDLGYPQAFSAAVEAAALQAGAQYSSAGRMVLARSRSGEAVYLADDGHWSAAGARLVAHALRQYSQP
jgi:hypothetical protein